MKKIISIILCVVISTKMYAQQMSYTPLSYTPLNLNLQQQQYLKTHKALKTSAWVAIGVGGTMVICMGGYILLSNAVADEKWRWNESESIPINWLLVSGGVLTVASVPLFIVSHHYKNMAVNASLGMQQAFAPQQGGMRAIAQPAVTLSFGL